jgi:hypothetical protein
VMKVKTAEGSTPPPEGETANDGRALLNPACIYEQHNIVGAR